MPMALWLWIPMNELGFWLILADLLLHRQAGQGCKIPGLMHGLGAVVRSP